MQFETHRAVSQASMLRISRCFHVWGKSKPCAGSYRASKQRALLSNKWVNRHRAAFGEQRCRKATLGLRCVTESDGSWRHGIKSE